VRYVPAGVCRPHIVRGTGDTIVVAGPQSSRGGAGDHEEVPRSAQGPTGHVGDSVRAETAAPEEEPEPTEAPDKAQRRCAVRRDAQLLLLPAVLRDLRDHILRRRDNGQVGCQDRS